MKKLYGFKLPHGKLYLYGENIKICAPYIDNTCNNVEDIYFYCQQHELNIYHEPDISLWGLLEIFLVNVLKRKYNVYGTKKEIYTYIMSLKSN